MAIMKTSSKKKILAIATIGEKGQIVIPAEARAAMKLTKGEKLVVMSSHENALVIMKAAKFEAMATHVTENLASIRKLIKKDITR